MRSTAPPEGHALAAARARRPARPSAADHLGPPAATDARSASATGGERRTAQPSRRLVAGRTTPTRLRRPRSPPSARCPMPPRFFPAPRARPYGRARQSLLPRRAARTARVGVRRSGEAVPDRANGGQACRGVPHSPLAQAISSAETACRPARSARVRATRSRRGSSSTPNNPSVRRSTSASLPSRRSSHLRTSAAVIRALQRPRPSRASWRSRAARTRSRTVAEDSPGAPPIPSALGCATAASRSMRSASAPLNFPC